MAKIILSGGSGLIGSQLTGQLISRGHSITHLSTSRRPSPFQVIHYNPAYGPLSEEAANAVLQSDVVIHLGGEPIAAKRWTQAQKKKIIESRVHSTGLLADSIRNAALAGKRIPRCYIQASAIGYYGNRDDEWVDETSKAGTGFLAETVSAWEEAASPIRDILPCTFLRIGVVLDANQGALPRMAMPVKLFAGAIPGSGKQWMSWIHIEDLIHLLTESIDRTELNGIYNAVSPEPLQAADFMKTIARALHRPTIMPHIPAVALKLAMGEMSEVILSGSRVSSKKLEEAGFQFRYPTLDGALKDLLQ